MYAVENPGYLKVGKIYDSMKVKCEYIDIDESAMDVRLTNKENGDGSNGAPALYANIPILNIKDEVRQTAQVEKNNKTKQNKQEDKKTKNTVKNQDSKTQNNKQQENKQNEAKESKNTQNEKKKQNNDKEKDKKTEQKQEKLKNNTKEYKIENTININNNNEVDLNSIAQNSTSEVTNETSKIINDVENEKYFVRDGNYYAVINGKETNIISKEEACDIADDEARKEKYQYQGWHSEFYSRGKNKNEEPAADLVFELDDINRVYYWEEQWQTNKYKGQVMWQIRLFDENDALASLYIYVDAINGDILGAGKSSD